MIQQARIALSGLLSLTAATILTTACSTQIHSAATWPLPQFCSEAQMLMAGSKLRAENIVHSDFAAFTKSKPQVRPLQTEQFNTYSDAANSKLRQISCKMKTTDHLRAEYGADSAAVVGVCASVDQHTLAGVLRGLTSSERRSALFQQGRAVVFDAEQVTTNGPEWLLPYPIAYTGADAKLHIAAKAMRNDWLDPRYAGAPARFRGTRYCHLIAPDYLRAILLGEESVGSTPPPPLAPPIAPIFPQQ